MADNRRCPECDAIMCYFKYKHNGVEKVGYRCPSPHGLRSGIKKDFAILEFTRAEELPDDV